VYHIDLEGEIAKTQDDRICIEMSHNWYRKWWGLPLGMPHHMDLMKRLLEFREKEFHDIKDITFDDEGDWCHLRYTIDLHLDENCSLYEAYWHGKEITSWADKIVDSAQDKVSELVHKISDEYSTYKLVDIPDLIKRVTTAKSANEKGRVLEELISRVFTKISGFRVIERLLTETEEIDLVIFNESSSTFWQKESPLILVECKNWSSTCGKNELVVFKEKLLNRRGRAKIGFFVSWNGFASTFAKEDLRSSQGDILLIPVSGGDVLDALASDDIEDAIKGWWINAMK